MKIRFIKSFLTLLSISIVYSSNTDNNNSDYDDLNNGNLLVNVNKDALNLSNECLSNLNKSNEFKECSESRITLSNHDNVCNSLQSMKCKKFFENPLFYLPDCKNDKAIMELYSESMIQTKLASIKLLCTKDDQGKLCPVVENSLNKKKIDIEAINKTCQSKSCIEGFSQFLTNIIKNIDGLEKLSFTRGRAGSTKEVYSVLLEKLNSQECLYLSNQTSGSISILYNTNISLFTIGLILLFLII